MKKQYNSPEMEVERFLFEDILTNSNLGTGEGAGDNENWGAGEDEGFNPDTIIG